MSVGEEDTPLSDFGRKLVLLCSAELNEARRDPERYADMTERLAAALGFTTAMAARGDPATIDRMLAGAEAYAHGEAVHKAPLARMFGKALR